MEAAAGVSCVRGSGLETLKEEAMSHTTSDGALKVSLPSSLLQSRVSDCYYMPQNLESYED
jgi:hypothetical protein